jgi:pyrimidine operon attenuation protein/uracil phosphoribosyltransferase
MTFDRANLEQVLRQLADEVLAHHWSSASPAGQELPWLLGVQHGGAAVARELAAILALTEGQKPLVGQIDADIGCDDAWLRAHQDSAGPTDLPGDVSEQRVLLVVDVLASGRAVLEALAELSRWGQARTVGLAALVDLGGREVPIQPQAVGLRLSSPTNQHLRLICDSHGRIDRLVGEATPPLPPHRT